MATKDPRYAGTLGVRPLPGMRLGMPPPVPTPRTQVADADSMKLSFERTLDVMRAWNQRASIINDMATKIHALTGEVYSQGQWVKAK